MRKKCPKCDHYTDEHRSIKDNSVCKDRHLCRHRRSGQTNYAKHHSGQCGCEYECWERVKRGLNP